MLHLDSSNSRVGAYQLPETVLVLVVVLVLETVLVLVPVLVLVAVLVLLLPVLE